MFVAELMDEVAAILLDTAHVAYSQDFLLVAFNDSMRFVCNEKADAYIVQGPIPLVDGVVQTLPVGGISLIDIQKNEGNGKVVTLVDRELLDEENRFWPNPVGGAQHVIEHYAVDERNPTRFFVTPPHVGINSLTGTYGAVPASVLIDDIATTDIPLLPNFIPAMRAYMLAYAYGKNSKRQDPTKHTAYMQEAVSLIGMRTQSQFALAPKVSGAQGV